jgi:hypothetical protein
MSEGRKNPAVWFWGTVVFAAVLVLYPLSQGPVLWVYITRGEPVLIAKILRAYRPIYIFTALFPKPASKPYRRYCSWWIHRAERSPSREPLTP